MRWALDEFLKRRVSGRIALADHSRVHAAIREPLQRELVKVLGFSSEFETELYVRRFETDFARICDRRYAVGTHSGTSALQLSLAAHGIGPGDEVITVPFTYIATALAISNTGARPVFVDIDHATFNMDPCLIEAAITPRTKAIVPVHLYGQIANMIEITRIAEAHGLKVVEDACQAFGAELHGRKAGTLGDAGCFSFSTPKNLSGFGNGGMVVSNNRSLIEEIRALRNPESNTPSILHSHRTPCYLDAIQIAFLRAKFPLVREWIAQRRANVELYRSSLGDLDLELPVESQGARHTYYRFAVRTKRRNQLRHWLNQRGIRAVNPYSPCLHLTRTYAELGHSRGAFPNSEAAEREALLLPVSNFITDEERTKILHDVQGFFAMSS
jgi:dTDP-4-amino-4,6-dideoxygalactose transaminase